MLKIVHSAQEVKDSVCNHWDALLFSIQYLCFVPSKSPTSSAVTHSYHWLRVLLLLASLSEIGILAAAVGGACGIILILLGIFVAMRFYRRKRAENDLELQPREHERKDPTVWWGLKSRSSSAPLPLGTGVESDWLFGSTLLEKTSESWGGEESSMFAPPMWTSHLLLQFVYFSIRYIMYLPFHLL